MSLVISGLADYTQKATEIFKTEKLYSPMIERFFIQKGVDYKQKLEYGTAAVTLQGAGCSLTAGGTGTFTEKDVETAVIQAPISFCFSDVRKKGSTLQMIQTALYTEVANSFAKKVDTMTWVGDTTTTGSTDLFNGFRYWIDNTTGVLASGFGATALTVTNVDEAVAKMITKFFATEDLVGRQNAGEAIEIYAPWSTVALYKANRLAANYYAAKDTILANDEMWVFGYEGQIKLVAVAGLTGVDDMYLTWAKNLVIVLDEVTDKTSFKIVVDEIKDLVYAKPFTKRGTQIKFASEIITLRT